MILRGIQDLRRKITNLNRRMKPKQYIQNCVEMNGYKQRPAIRAIQPPYVRREVLNPSTSVVDPSAMFVIKWRLGLGLGSDKHRVSYVPVPYCQEMHASSTALLLFASTCTCTICV